MGVHGFDETEMAKMLEVSHETKRAILQNLSLFNKDSCILEIRGHRENSLNGIWHFEQKSKCVEFEMDQRRKYSVIPKPERVQFDPSSRPYSCYEVIYRFSSIDHDATLKLRSFRMHSGVDVNGCSYEIMLNLEHPKGAGNSEFLGRTRVAKFDVGAWHTITPIPRKINTLEEKQEARQLSNRMRDMHGLSWHLRSSSEIQRLTALTELGYKRGREIDKEFQIRIFHPTATEL